jgi:hypothetical protein
MDGVTLALSHTRTKAAAELLSMLAATRPVQVSTSLIVFGESVYLFRQCVETGIDFRTLLPELIQVVDVPDS